MLDDLNPPRVNACSCGVESRETAFVFNAKGGDVSGALTGGDEEFYIRRDVERAGDFIAAALLQLPLKGQQTVCYLGLYLNKSHRVDGTGPNQP